MCPLCMTTIALIATGSVSMGGLMVFDLWGQKLSQPVRQKKSVTENCESHLATFISVTGLVVLGSLLMLSIAAGYQTPSLC